MKPTSWTPEVEAASKQVEAVHQAELEAIAARTPCPRCGKRCTYCDEYQTTKGWFAQVDDKGQLHLHDSNRREASFRCESGHVWSLRTPLTCPACGWEKQ